MGDEKRKKEEDAIRAKLQLLDKRMRLHEWSAFEQRQADELEEAEAEIDAGADVAEADD